MDTFSKVVKVIITLIIGIVFGMIIIIESTPYQLGMNVIKHNNYCKDTMISSKRCKITLEIKDIED